MILAALLSATKAIWSLLVAAALIWSGVDLTAIPYGDNAALSVATDSGEVRKEDAGDEDGEMGLAVSKSATSSIVPRQIGNSPGYFDLNAEYGILTRYGSATEVALGNFLADGITGVSFSLVSCDESRADYYRSVAVESGKLKLESNTLGQVHGSNTGTETVCTVSATGSDGDQSQEFSLYTVSDRTPPALLSGALAVAGARSDEIDLQVDMPGSSPGYLRIGWRVPGSQPNFAIAHGVTDDTVLTISGLQPDTSYDIRAYLMTVQAFDLYRSSNTGAAGALIMEGDPEAKWISNLAGSGLGKSLSISQATLPAPEPTPNPLPNQTPEATLAPTSRPMPDEDEEDDSDGIDTPTPTDNDGTDSDGIDTPTPTDNDGTDSDGIDTPSAVTPPTPTPDTPPTPESGSNDDNSGSS